MEINALIILMNISVRRNKAWVNIVKKSLNKKVTKLHR